MSEPLPAWLTDPGAARLWVAVRDRLERNGLRPAGSLTLIELTREERHAIGDVLGRPLVSARVSVDLDALDILLARRSGLGGLVAVTEAVTGAALCSRPALRSAQAANREAPFRAGRDWLRHHPDVHLPWIEPWLAGLRSSGALTAAEDGPVRLCQALEVLAAITAARSPQTPRTRTALAASLLHNAHALDEGSLLAQLVLRGLAAAANEPVPATTTDRRRLWESFAVSTDAVSSTCLTLGLRAGGDGEGAGGGPAGRLNAAAEAGDPVHLTGWDLRRLGPFAPGRPVLVCENPAVLEAAAVRFGAGVPVVCSAGQPALVVLEVLRRLGATGAELRYHGDFDWPGIAIANRLVEQVGVRPWRMTAADYRDAAPGTGLRLAGREVAAGWDPQLAVAMRTLGVAVHEEAVLESLLEALSPG